MYIKDLFFLMASIFLGSLFFQVFGQDSPAATKQPSSSIPPVESSANTGVSMRVLWTVTEYRLGSEALRGEEDARALLFKPLDIDRQTAQITFAGQTCRDVVFEKHELSSKEYLEKTYHATPQLLGVNQETLEVIKTNCNIPGFKEYIRLNDSRLIVYIEGVFFFFQPNINY